MKIFDVWPNVQPAPRTAGGIFFVGPTAGREFYRTLEWWNEQEQVGEDRIEVLD